MSIPTAIRSQKDFASGVLYILAGCGFAFVALDYRLGDAARMGPGYFPFWLGILLALVGVVVLASSMRAKAVADTLPRIDVRTVLWIIGPVVLFGLLLEPLGLVLSLVMLIMLSSMASHDYGWKGAVLNMLVLMAISLGAFIFGLNLQMPLWPSFIG